MSLSFTYSVLIELLWAKYWLFKDQQAKILVLEEPTVEQRRRVHKWAILKQSGSADTERHGSAYMWHLK